MTGGKGGISFFLSFGGRNGGDGVRFESGELFMTGTACAGGDGGAGVNIGGGGGNGITVGGTAYALDCAFSGGAGGTGGLFGGIPGNPGLPVAITTGALTTLAGGARHFKVRTPARELQTIDLEFGGVPGEEAWLIASLEQAAGIFFIPLEGVILTDLASANLFEFGIVPPSGTLQLTLPVPALTPTLLSARIYLQSLFVDASASSFVLGPASVLVILDQTL